MRTTLALAALSSVVLVNAQNPPAATPSNAVIISGDASYDGPVIKGTTGKLGNAQVITNNPLGAQYKATFSDSKTYVRGSLTAQTGPGGKGVQFSISVSGFPSANAGPFLYHIHQKPVPADGNCTATAAHLDPYQRGAIPPCDSSDPATCQVGDLAGKHGNITSDPFSASFLDPYVSDVPGDKASFVGLSVVVHTSNTTRLNCANFVLVSNSTSSNSTGSTNSSSSPSSPTPTPYKPSPGGAAVNVASVGVVAAGLLGLAAFLL